MVFFQTISNGESDNRLYYVPIEDGVLSSASLLLIPYFNKRANRVKHIALKKDYFMVMTQSNNFYKLKIDGQSRFKSFTAYHQGEMPIFFLSYKSNVQVNSMPFKLSLLCKNSDQNWNDFIVNIEPYSGGNMAFIVISKILSTKNQLLCQLSNRFTQIFNSNNIYSDITITCL
ncbi:predicted protein [Naegleria gruberi]|uniref:Predicted protein n=1 Tax=Naegleria gruberi TaxID=5762 RepID=D2VKU4_NAEGR|nr:uncharacterized protein NAEGRDRAFT_69553 [Naegleria gruberi]EFC42501.1 predicted protein [Naegleria gruberi]|eukprot:XP_002675245.1 predicted protein [Naegleria gruberi strain NEG-M]